MQNLCQGQTILSGVARATGNSQVGFAMFPARNQWDHVIQCEIPTGRKHSAQVADTTVAGDHSSTVHLAHRSKHLSDPVSHAVFGHKQRISLAPLACQSFAPLSMLSVVTPVVLVEPFTVGSVVQTEGGVDLVSVRNAALAGRRVQALSIGPVVRSHLGNQPITLGRVMRFAVLPKPFSVRGSIGAILGKSLRFETVLCLSLSHSCRFRVGRSPGALLRSPTRLAFRRPFPLTPVEVGNRLDGTTSVASLLGTVAVRQPLRFRRACRPLNAAQFSEACETTSPVDFAPPFGVVRSRLPDQTSCASASIHTANCTMTRYGVTRI